MSQRLSQQKKQSIKKLTIHEISPQWARLLPLVPKTEVIQFYKDGRTVLDITNPKFCIVGEAHGFRDNYYYIESEKGFCEGCREHSIDFSRILQNKPSNRKELVDSFVNHWNQRHT